MNKLIYTISFIGKSVLKRCKFHYKKLKLKFKRKELNQTTNMTYESAINILSNIYLEKEISFEKPIRSKDVNYDVSIIVPAFNAEKTIYDCLKSILNQKTKYTFEIICINDGSTDLTNKIIDSLKKDIIIINQKNMGLSEARNAGMRIAKGKYFLFVDSDDLLPQNAIDNLMTSALKTDADIIQGSIAKCSNDGKIFFVNKCHDIVTNDIKEMYDNNLIGTAWGKLYRRNLWDEIDFFKNYNYEDAIIWCNIFSKCTRMSFISKEVYIFRSSKNSLFKRQNNSNKCIDSIWIIKKCIELHKYMNMQETNDWYQMIVWQLSVGIITRIRLFENDEVLQAAFVIGKNLVEHLNGYQNCTFKGKNKKIYEKLEESFSKAQYSKWIEYSKLLSYSNKI